MLCAFYNSRVETNLYTKISVPDLSYKILSAILNHALLSFIYKYELLVFQRDIFVISWWGNYIKT